MENSKLTQTMAKIAYFGILRPFIWLRSKIVARRVTRRLNAAKKRATHETEITGKPRYVVFSNGRFYVYNKGGMMALAKAYRKRTGLSIEWRKLYVFETHVQTPAEKAELERKKQEEKK